MVKDRLSEFQNRLDGAAPLSEQFYPPAPPNDQVSEINVSRLAYDTANRSQRFLQHINECENPSTKLQRRISTLSEKQSSLLSQTIVRPEEKEQLELLIDEIKQPH
uniref:Uncharacterized protein n=1 Tax=Ditylenchus dipsaci TaxID=166011 RepID=A0A915EPK9_9BILA